MILSLYNKKPAPNGVGLGRWKTDVFKSRVSSELRAFTAFAKNAVLYAFEAPGETCALWALAAECGNAT